MMVKDIIKELEKLPYDLKVCSIKDDINIIEIEKINIGEREIILI